MHNGILYVYLFPTHIPNYLVLTDLNILSKLLHFHLSFLFPLLSILRFFLPSFFRHKTFQVSEINTLFSYASLSHFLFLSSYKNYLEIYIIVFMPIFVLLMYMHLFWIFWKLSINAIISQHFAILFWDVFFIYFIYFFEMYCC